MDLLTEELINISKYELTKLPIFLKKYGNYDMLKDIIKNIENEKIPFLKNFMLGNLGYEHYKQSAFYELPTNELIFTILFIFNYFNITNCYELYAGMGLLSKMLKLHSQSIESFNIKWESSDDYSWIETINNNIFNVDVEKKCFLTYITKKQVIENDCYIFCWPDISIKNYIGKFCREKNPNIIILIDNINKCTFDNKNVIKSRYKKLNLNLKQICFNDIKDYFDKFSVSTTTIYIKNELVEKYNINLTEDFIVKNVNLFIDKYFNSYNSIINNILLPSKYEININNIKISLINNYKVPEEFINILDDEFYEIVKTYGYVIDSINMPLFLKSTSDIICWMKLYKSDNCPKNIKTYEKFIQFMKLYKKTYDDLEELKKENIIPPWVSNKTTARKCIALDYSIDDKKWKKSEYQFKNMMR